MSGTNSSKQINNYQKSEKQIFVVVICIFCSTNLAWQVIVFIIFIGEGKKIILALVVNLYTFFVFSICLVLFSPRQLLISWTPFSDVLT